MSLYNIISYLNSFIYIILHTYVQHNYIYFMYSIKKDAAIRGNAYSVIFSNLSSRSIISICSVSR